jgi:hypothetical protein
MSTILKALRRLEEDRGAQSQEPLREEVTRDSAAAKSRSGGWPLLRAPLVLGLGVAVGLGALAFWYLGRAPEPAQPTELAAASTAEPRAERAPAAKRARGARRARPRSTPALAKAPSAASERELPAPALASKVDTVKRPPAQPRIAAPESAEPQASARADSGLPRRMDVAEIPGRHKPAVSRSRSARPPSIVARPKAPVPPAGAPAPAGAEAPATSPVLTASAEQELSRPAALPEAEPRAEQPRETASKPVVLAEAPGPEPAASEPLAGSGAGRAGDAERPATTPRPEPTRTVAVGDGSSTKAARPAAVAARQREPGKSASSEVPRAKIPELRVESTVWHPIAERRLAFIQFDQSAGRREVREGDAVGSLVVSKIEPSGVVFVHEGVEVRRRIGD